ncbi:flavin reductase family protein [Methylobrevis albus]|uniref:Iron-sulfur cluster-binding domain-containing protein n=1 Tax=Methylobrevis albus TaxID=2793297 RepID=A0A931I062_9HYPH|nr:iron-sulfur cluster-binding domain-containing protein [Methylobrevis albus]MBH0237327.1 iron-sulfur cluster-binding domain-containing protein [Methylobrevis albus]
MIAGAAESIAADVGMSAAAPRAMQLVCEAVRREAEGVKTFVLRPAGGAPVAFKAGQYLTIAVPAGGSTLWRSFTIASSPADAGRIELTIKAQDTGRATRWLHDHLGPGAEIEARGPFGDFHLPDAFPKPLVLLSAGSGATPMAAMARTIADFGLDVTLDYVHCARTPADLLFRPEIDALAAARRGWRTRWIVSGGGIAPGATLGRPDAAMLARLVPDLGSSEVFCCGPAGFMAAARAAFDAAGGLPAAWHEEGFGEAVAEAALAAVAAAPAPEAGSLPVRIEPRGVEIAVRAGETILEAALRSGVPLPSSCRKGMCSTCRVRKLSGEVDMQQDGGLFDDEVEAGDILACCSRPLTPLVIEIA